MSQYIRKSRSLDIMIFGEGTYPYIRGGVSSWIHQLITGMPDLKFGIIFLGSIKSDYGEILYELPDNLVHLEVHYLFDEDIDVEDKGAQTKRRDDIEEFENVEMLYQTFKKSNSGIPDIMKNVDFYEKEVTHEHFLHSRQSWSFINEKYYENCSDVPFIDYFWTVKNIHRPIWKLASIVKKLPKCKIFHSPSTGYAGFLGALASYDSDKPFILTEHGIYTRERKIDMLTADWIDFKKPTLLKQPEEFNYIKKMWVSFFEKIGEFSYTRANPILSLFSGARDIQIAFGADETKALVVPNGVDVDGLRQCYLARTENVPKVITLIGRVVSIKDIKTFIRSIRIVANIIPDIEAWVVGPMDEDEEYAAECENMVNTLGLSSNFYFKGFQNIKDILPKTGLLTLTSISEGMPLTILEGYAAGVPCVATDVGSCKDLIFGGLGEEDIALGKAGDVTSIANPSALAESYIRFLTDDDLWKKAQQSALARVERYYRQDMFLLAYRNIYNKAMK
ncbi:MAG: GT4 family glycosyltransferase PelF [Campylobacterota bacterium]|nr:GT4 family glycosyltransferase PelF [Campylobacterota bacterium]